MLLSKSFKGTKNLICLSKRTLILFVCSAVQNLSRQEVSSFELYKTEITTCDELYKSWKKTNKLYRNAPEKGLTMDVEYIDTKNELISQSKRKPIVLALHGSPGTYHTFDPFITHLTQQGARVISPNFPKFDLYTKTNIWRHSGEEKGEFIKDFLRKIQVKKIDMILAHSDASYPTLHLFSAKNEFDIRSIGFFNACGNQRINAMKPSLFADGTVRMILNRLGRFWFRLLGPTLFKMINGQVDVTPDDMDQMMLTAMTMYYSGFKNTENLFTKIKDSGIPLLFAFSKNDDYVSEDQSLALLKILGGNENNISVYNSLGNMIKTAELKSPIQVLEFQSGGHYSYLKYSNLLIKATSNLLNKSMIN